MVGPVYGQQVGLAVEDIAYFLAAFVLGGAIGQIPAGWLADRYDRRWVLIVVSLLSVFACLGTITLGASSKESVYVAAMLFGLVTFPIFSLSAAHANDFATPEQAVEISASLMFLYGIGAIASPLGASVLMQRAGPEMLFIVIAMAHAALAVFGLIRMLTGRQASTRVPYRYLPRTSFTLARLLRRGQNEESGKSTKPHS